MVLKNRREGEKKKCTQAKGALFIFVFFVIAIIQVLQSQNFSQSDVPNSEIED